MELQLSYTATKTHTGTKPERSRREYLFGINELAAMWFLVAKPSFWLEFMGIFENTFISAHVIGQDINLSARGDVLPAKNHIRGQNSEQCR